MIAELGVNDWLGITAAIVGGLSLFGGATWWMSAMWSKLCEVAKQLETQANEKSKDDEVIWKHINGHADLLQKHEREILLLQNYRTEH
jgi:hypothetical protein